ncbi:MAG: dipeptide/oligopeptide/nickel ABC transporter ATP-binding protein, partial [Spirochaetaceae bacterium]|nr:dipeptide/oligopeptide/nickel ABC transporter ATP-binding protein [Spirochaetaceae bacterium]
MTLGFVTVFVALIGGLVIGGLSGYIGGITDWVIMRLAETVMLLPTFYFFLFLRSIMPSGISPEQKFFFIMV